MPNSVRLHLRQQASKSPEWDDKERCIYLLVEELRKEEEHQNIRTGLFSVYLKTGLFYIRKGVALLFSPVVARVTGNSCRK